MRSDFENPLLHEDAPLLFSLGFAALVALCAYPFLRAAVVYFWDRAQRKKLVAEIAAQRHIQPEHVQNLVVRRTDLQEKLTLPEKERLAEAEQLVTKGHIREAVTIFEELNHQRRAVDVLEAHQLLDEAAAVLMRLNAPNRAAVIYERNGKFATAAEYYIRGNLPGFAADALRKAAVLDPQYFNQAADMYRSLNKKNERAACLAAALDTQSLVAEYRHSDGLEALLHYMWLPQNAADVYQALSRPEWETLLARVPTTPLNMRLLAQWLEMGLAQDDKTLKLILEHATARRDLETIFFSSLSADLRTRVLDMAETLPLSPACRRAIQEMRKAGKVAA